MTDTAASDSSVRSWLRRYRGWFMVYIAYLEMFLALGSVYNYSILFLSLQEEFKSNAALTGWVGSLANGLLCSGSPLSVPFLSRFGPRMTTILGVLLYCGGFVATSFVPALEYAFITYGLLAGFGTNFIFQSVCFLVLDWFPVKNCSRATALSFVGPTSGMMALAPLMNTLIETYNWRNSLRILGVGNLVIGLIHAVFIVQPTPTKSLTVNEKNPDRAWQRDTPADEAGDDLLKRPTTPRRRLARILLRVDTWMWLLCLMLGNLGWSFVVINFASFMEHDLHFSREQILLTIVVFAVGEISGKVALSAVGDHLPFLKLYVIAAASILGGIASGLTIVVRTTPVMFTISFLLGMFRAGSYGMPLSAGMQIFDDYGPDTVSTLVLIPWGFGIFIGAPISGGLYDLTGDYTVSLLVIAAIFFCSAATVLVIPVRQRLQQRAGYRRTTEGDTAVDVDPAEEKNAAEFKSLMIVVGQGAVGTDDCRGTAV